MSNHKDHMEGMTEVNHFKYWVLPLMWIFVGRVYQQGTNVWSDENGKVFQRQYFIRRVS